MTPMLGILASQITGHLSTNSFESIQTVTVGSGGQSSISFSSIPSTYKHLELRCIARDGGTSNDTSSFKMTFNSDTTSTYARHYLYGEGSSASSGFNQLTGFMYMGCIVQNGATASVFGSSLISIIDYQNTNKYKTVKCLAGADWNGTGNITFSSGLWQSTSAITNISITSSSATNFAQYSSFALYGVK